VTRPATRRLVAVALLGLLAGLLAGPPVGLVAAPGAAAQGVRSAATLSRAPEDADPLQVVIERITPSTVPQQGRIRVTGRIVNRSDSEWSQLKVYLLTSFEPLTTPAALGDALRSDVTAEIGDRIVAPNLFALVPDLAPGESTSFRLSVPRSAMLLSGAPGVYWLGVHVLGEDERGRIDGTDGRARTFLPLVPESSTGTELALGLQFRNRVVRTPEGELRFLPWWQQAFTDDGRLGRLLGLSRTAGGFPLTWLVDPDVLRAATSVARGNPALSLTPEPGETPEEQATEPDEEDEVSLEDLPPEARLAARWLRRFDRDAVRHTVLSLPFADLDVSAAVRAGSSALVTRARAESTEILDTRGIASRSTLAPLTGFLSPEALRGTDSRVPVILSDAALPDLVESGSRVSERSTGGTILAVPPTDALVGPSPGPESSALTVRQNILAQAALHALSRNRDQPFAVLLPPGWNPGEGWEQSGFFRGLDVPWLRPTSFGEVFLDGVASDEVEADSVVYPEEEADAELPSGVVLTATRLLDDVVTLRELLTEESPVSNTLDEMALLGVSTWNRPFPGRAAERMQGVRGLIRSWMAKVTVRGPSFVTMSSEDGPFPITIVNGLDQPVTVGLRTSVSGGALRLVTPDPVELAPGGRRLLRIEATSSDIGIHEVTVQPITASGSVIGAGTTVSIRSSRVGLIVWVIMGVGAAILFITIVLRLVRRLRSRRLVRGGR